jgi:hypothetical protein
MENNNPIQYTEAFFFRTRVHTLEHRQIRTRQNDFFVSSEIVTNIQDLGHRLQYTSDMKLLDIFVSVVFLILGTVGLSKSTSDNFLFAISIILIFVALYWAIHVLFYLQYVGSFYFSHSTSKAKGAFEIKSKYPASEALRLFLDEIQLVQRDIAIENLINYLDKDTPEEAVLSQALYLKHTFRMPEDAYEALIARIKAKMDKFH